MGGLIGLTLIIGLTWPSAADVERATRSVLSDSAYQTELKVRPSSAPSEFDKSNIPDYSWRPLRQAPPRPESQIGILILWVVGGIGLAALLFFIIQGFIDRPRPVQVATAEPVPQPKPAIQVDPRVLSDAEALAQAGQFADAIHVLLLRTVRALSQTRALATHLTSREIVASVPMHEQARHALNDLVATVEVSLFGAAEPTADDFIRCRASYERVLSAEGVAAG